MKKTLLLLLCCSFLGKMSATDFCNNTPERAWWDVLHYELTVDFDLPKNKINGTCKITSRVLANKQSVMAIDLQEPMKIDSVWYLKNYAWQPVEFLQKDKANQFHIMIPFASQLIDDEFEVKIFFHGNPTLAKHAPWDGGLVAKKDKNKLYWWTMACQGKGASLWFPCKDLNSDEPDLGVDLYYQVPKKYTAIGNGILVDSSSDNNIANFHWRVVHPINLYNITFYIGEYTHQYYPWQSKAGKQNASFFLLKENENKLSHLTDLFPKMMEAFEYWCGTYPFIEDGYKLVEAPYLGMEHQSAIAYGNGFKNGYLGQDRSNSGVGYLFDFILIHESAHEWFGNSITVANPCDMWIQEGFTTYMESLFIENVFGIENADSYRIGKQKIIQNDKPVRGECANCKTGSVDEYDKGSALVHNLRLAMKDDSLFRKMLLTMNDTFRYKVIDSKMMQDFLQAYFDFNITPILQQYLEETRIPFLEVKRANNILHYKWSNCIDSFNMPYSIIINDTVVMLHPTTYWQKMVIPTKNATIKANYNWYVNTIID